MNIALVFLVLALVVVGMFGIGIFVIQMYKMSWGWALVALIALIVIGLAIHGFASDIHLNAHTSSR